jgi:hypothetical protein
MITETTFQAALLRELNAPNSGIRVWRQNAGTLTVAGSRGKRTIHLAPEGAADLVGIAEGGLFLEVECKGPTARVTSEQSAHGAMIQERGGVWVCVRAGKHRSLEEAVAEAMRAIRGAIAERRRANAGRLRGGDGSTTPPGAPYGTGNRFEM